MTKKVNALDKYADADNEMKRLNDKIDRQATTYARK
jgi:hypothetical protein